MSIELAHLSLTGLSVGDAFGELFFNRPLPSGDDPAAPPGTWRWTDDTAMALSIVEILQECGHIDPDQLAAAFARRYAAEPYRGYGGGARRLLERLEEGADWRQEAPKIFPGGSYGNGGAMRAAPIGGFYAGDPELAAAEGRLASAVTHAHPEGQAGGMAVAAAAALAATNGPSGGQEFIAEVAAFVPGSLVRDGLRRALTIPPYERATAVAELGNGSRISAQDTVPYCVWSVAHHLADYRSALWETVHGGGDMDTTCAIVGGIVALAVGDVPTDWLRRREPLPQEFASH